MLVKEDHAGGSREKKDIFVSVVSEQQPRPLHASSGIQSSFGDELQSVLSRLLSSDILILLGDFSARVGKSLPGDDLRRGVRGQHGVGRYNEAGEALLELCATNNLTNINTWFTKKLGQLANWKHPATKRWHMIDYVVMRSDQRKLCCDVQVRDASCWSVHNMIIGKAKIHLPHLHSQRSSCSSNLPLAVHLSHDQEGRKIYKNKLDQSLLDHPHDCGGPGKKN